MSDIILTTLVFALKAISAVFDIVTALPYYLVQNPGKAIEKSKRLKAVPVSGKPADAWRSLEVPPSGLTTSLFPECRTLPDLFTRACKQYVNQPCLGTRELLSEEDEIQPNKKVFKKVVLGDYKWMVYSQLWTQVKTFGNGLVSLGQQPKSQIVIFAETRAEWMIAAQACFMYNFPVVTLYATLGQDAIVHGINETKVAFVITSLELVQKFNDILPLTPTVTHVVVMGCTKLQLEQQSLTVSDSVKVITMMEVEKIGSQSVDSAPSQPPEPDDTAVIMYTSGSTGLPKGVIISHRNLLCGTSGQCERIPELGCDDIYVGYLPLAHVLELSAELSCVALGTRIGYSSPTTLTDKSTKIKKGTLGDVSVLKPSLMAAVPVIMDRIYKNVWDHVSSGSVLQRALFRFAYEYKLKHLVNGYSTPLCDKYIFKNVKNILGGKVRLMLSGGAPLSSTTQRFMNVCFCCPVGQGYGLTETCGAGTVVEFTDLSTDRVGAPLICCEIRLRNWEEGGYTTEDLPCPRGEILVGGGQVSLGYYNNPEKTAEDFTTIGGIRYFCTGDIGQFDADGCLKIIDRKKDLVKLQHGEYIAVSRVETILKMCPLVEQICIIAHSDQSSVVGLVIASELHLKTLAKSLGLPDVDHLSLCHDPKVVAAVLKELSSWGTKAKLQRVEIPSRISLFPEIWLPESGLVTDSFKFKRRVIEDRYHELINSLYAS